MIDTAHHSTPLHYTLRRALAEVDVDSRVEVRIGFTILLLFTFLLYFTMNHYSLLYNSIIIRTCGMKTFTPASRWASVLLYSTVVNIILY